MPNFNGNGPRGRKIGRGLGYCNNAQNFNRGQMNNSNDWGSTSGQILNELQSLQEQINSLKEQLKD